MKKTVCMLLVLLMLAASTACSGGKGTPAAEALATEAPAAEAPAVEAPAVEAPAAGEPRKIDVDLTVLSSTMIYSEVFNIMSHPEEYIGKTIKMIGMFSVYEIYANSTDPLPESIYYACVIKDATACCESGLEFVLAGDCKYPEDYPKRGSIITVVGEFQTYYEGENRFAHLVNAEFV